LPHPASTLFPELKRLGLEADPSLPSGAEVNAWSYASTPHSYFAGVVLKLSKGITSFIFTFLQFNGLLPHSLNEL
jgi:hypothetical protein